MLENQCSAIMRRVVSCRSLLAVVRVGGSPLFFVLMNRSATFATVMSTTGIHSDLTAEFEAAASEAGCELLNIDFSGSTLRLTIEREPEGISHRQCTDVSRRISALLDAWDFANGNYVLEVTSPGLDRPFFQASDYHRFSGRRVKVTWHDQEIGKRSIIGLLEGAGEENGDDITVLQDTGERHTIRVDAIEKTRLEIEI